MLRDKELLCTHKIPASQREKGPWKPLDQVLIYSKKSCHYWLDRLSSRLQLNIFSEVEITSSQAPTISIVCFKFNFYPYFQFCFLDASPMSKPVFHIPCSNTPNDIFKHQLSCPPMSHQLLFKAKKYGASICIQVYYVGPSSIIWWLVSTITC